MSSSPAASFVLPASCGLANAVRRTLLSDLPSWAPYEVVMRTNTSCHTDEFLAHRIGLIPFRRVGNGDEMTLRADGPGTLYARDLVGPAFEAVEGGVPVVVLGEGQCVDATVRFDERPASVHARYSQVAGVDYNETFCSTLRAESMRLFLADACAWRG